MPYRMHSATIGQQPFCQSSGIDPDFGRERARELRYFESENRCPEDRIRRLLGTVA